MHGAVGEGEARRSGASPSWSQQYSKLRESAVRTLRERFGLLRPTPAQVDTLIQQSWWRISDEVYAEYIRDSRGRRLVRLPKPLW